jgi:hypothetical protein
MSAKNNKTKQGENETQRKKRAKERTDLVKKVALAGLRRSCLSLIPARIRLVPTVIELSVVSEEEEGSLSICLNQRWNS